MFGHGRRIMPLKGPKSLPKASDGNVFDPSGALNERFCSLNPRCGASFGPYGRRIRTGYNSIYWMLFRMSFLSILPQLIVLQAGSLDHAMQSYVNAKE